VLRGSMLRRGCNRKTDDQRDPWKHPEG